MRKSAAGAGLVWVAVFLGSWLLWTNPGYFSHDELQWAAYAGRPGPIHWMAWLGVDAFQFRPLTFNLWQWLSRRLFDSPQLFHAVLVAWGAGNAALLCVLGRRLGIAPWPAALGAIVFALGPYAAYVHGWVGTIADLAWVSCALLIGLLAASPARAWLQVLGTVLLTAVALLAKEAAVAIPAILLAGWICLAGIPPGGLPLGGIPLVGAAQAATGLPGKAHRGFRRSNMLASAAIVALYLALRLPVLLDAPASASPYQLDSTLVPHHWLAYQLFPFLPRVFEVLNTLAGGFTGSLALAGLLWLGVVAACWRTHWRLAAWFLLGGAAALAPVLPMSATSNQYGYGFAALACMAGAAAWSRAPRWGRAALVLAAVTCLWHGATVMRTMRHVGELQAVFSPALAQAVQDRDGDAPMRLRVAPGAEDWVFRRLSFEIPSYRGVPIGQRVRLVAADAPADAEIGADGSINPL